jgi:uncharacterized protein YabN with tetrapyrrole methylase and pyrophosphatase domain
MTTASLTIVGTGIQVAAQTTVQARAHMEQADKLLYLVADPATAYWIKSMKPDAESLQPLYQEGKNRIDTYREMVERILECLREGGAVCVAFYGHPGVFVYPSHEAIKRARSEGFNATMLPGISAEDCLFADLGIDPGESGCQSFEATDFLVYRRRFDPNVALVIWQIGVVGELGYRVDRMYSREGLDVLVETLRKTYGPDHEVVVYEAAQYPVCDPVIETVTLARIHDAHVTPISTLYVPPRQKATPDRAMLKRLGISIRQPAIQPAS